MSLAIDTTTEDRAVADFEDDIEMDFDQAEDEEEFQPAPFPGALTLIQRVWSSREDRTTKEIVAVEQAEIAVMPETFNVAGKGLRSWYDLPPMEAVTDPKTGAVTMERAKPKKNSKYGRFLKSIHEHIGLDPDTRGVDEEGNETARAFTLNKLAYLVAEADAGRGAYPLRATWQKVRMDFGRKIKSSPTLIIVGPHPESNGVKPASEFSAADLELAANVFVGRTDREIQSVVGTLELPPHVYAAVLAGTARKVLIDQGIIMKDKASKVYGLVTA